MFEPAGWIFHYQPPMDYLSALRRALRRDFFRSAVALWSAPVFAARSKAELTAGSMVRASCFLPARIRERYFLSIERRYDLTMRLWLRLRALLRMRRSADFVFGIALLAASSI
jgi:hypothetical protein